MQRRKRNQFSGFNLTPAKLGATAWWRPFDGQTGDGTGISAWVDVIGGKTLAQADNTKKPDQNTDGSLTFDGVDEFLATDAFTLNQPFTVYLYAQQISWTANDIIFDGFTYQSTMLAQGGVSPQVFSFAGSIGPVNGDWLSLGAMGRAICCVFNGASSSIRVFGATETTGNIGAQNAGGFTLGSGGAGTANFSNIRVWEVIINNGADSTTRQDLFLNYLNRRQLA